jgi:hypothetical protein
MAAGTLEATNITHAFFGELIDFVDEKITEGVKAEVEVEVTRQCQALGFSKELVR